MKIASGVPWLDRSLAFLFRWGLIFWLEILHIVLSEPDIELNIETSQKRRRAPSLVSHRNLDGINFYGSSEHEEVEALTAV
jgi:hypothetical protein